MKEFRIGEIGDLTDEQRKNKTLFLCDEGAITCATFRGISQKIDESGEVVLGMPDTELKEGLRGLAKARIIYAMSGVEQVSAVSHSEAVGQLNNGWKRVIVNGRLTWVSGSRLEGESGRVIDLKIEESDGELDRHMMGKAQEETRQSNCWLDPAGCLFVRDGEILVSGTSQSYNQSGCGEIPIKFEDLNLRQGERMLFCDAQHAERVGISKAARSGIALNGSTMYVTKYPCRPCLTSAIEAGVKVIVFSQGSYGLVETADIIQSHAIDLRRVSS